MSFCLYISKHRAHKQHCPGTTFASSLTRCQCRYCGKPSRPSTATFGTSILMSHCSVGQPCVLCLVYRQPPDSLQSASQGKLQVPRGEGCTPLTTPTMHMHPPWAAASTCSSGQAGDTQPLLFFSVCGSLTASIQTRMPGKGSSGRSIVAVPAATPGVFSELGQRCT